MKITKKLKLIFVLLSIVTPIISLGCVKNSQQVNSKREYSKDVYSATFISNEKESFRERGSYRLLPMKRYNQVVESMENKNILTFAIIFFQNYYLFKMKHKKGTFSWDYMQNFPLIGFKYHNDPLLSIWIGPFYKKSDPSILIKGESKNSNYGMDGYPMIYVNDKLANLGIGSYRPGVREIIELTYNHES